MNYKVSLIGDSGVGKSTWVKKLLTSSFETKHAPTLGVEVEPIVVEGRKYNVWDCAGLEKLEGLRDGYFIKSDFCIAMFDFSNPLSIKNLPKRILDFKRVCSNKKILVVGNKKELATNETILLAKQLQFPYIEMSVKNELNIFLPFKMLKL